MELLCTDNFIYMDKGFGTRGYTADLFSVQFGASSATCQMQFYYYMTSSSRNSRTCRYCVLPDSQMWKTPGPLLIILVPDDGSFKWEMWLVWDGCSWLPDMELTFNARWFQLQIPDIDLLFRSTKWWYLQIFDTDLVSFKTKWLDLWVLEADFW